MEWVKARLILIAAGGFAAAFSRRSVKADGSRNVSLFGLRLRSRTWT